VQRRRTAREFPPPTPPAEPAEPGGGAQGKGRPTPKRKEAEARRRQPIVATPTDRKGAREAARQRRVEMRTALERGDESRLPARDRGKARRFARDYVDSRRTLAEFFLPLGVVLYLPLLLVRSLAGIASTALMLLLVLMVVELLRLHRGLTRALRQRFDEGERRGAAFYGVTRAAQLRRWRLPRPQVAVGERPDRR